MSTPNASGFVIIDGERVEANSPRFKELLPITSGLLSEVNADNSPERITDALATALLSLEVELRNLKSALNL